MQKIYNSYLSVSVAMAAYNGEAYIRTQIETILAQLKDGDEIVISLDPSSDGTESIIKEFEKNDKRVKMIRGQGQGLVANFENAIRNCCNDIIFLCDQDDVWHEHKVDKVLRCFQNPKTNVVMHDATVINSLGECVHPSFIEIRGCRTGIIKNIIKNSYIGCCMAFRRSIRSYILPFPEKIPMHDQWIGLIGEITGENIILQEPLIDYRRHEGNASSETHAGFKQMLCWRMTLIYQLLKFRIKYFLHKER